MQELYEDVMDLLTKATRRMKRYVDLQRRLLHSQNNVEVGAKDFKEN